MNENGVQDSLDWESEEIWTFNSSEKSSKHIEYDSNGASGSQSLVLPTGVDVPPSNASRKRVALSSSGGDDGEEPARHNEHTMTERERRKKMRNMFTNLLALLPQLPSKVDDTTIVDGAVNYIQTLEQKLLNLKKMKQERLHTLNYLPIFPSINSNDDHVTTATTLVAKYDGCGSSNSVFAPADAKNISPFVAPSVLKFPTVYKTWSSPNVSVNVCGYDAHISVCCPNKRGLFTTICYVLDKYKIEVISAHASSDHHKSMFMIHTRVTTGSTEEIYKQAAKEIITLST